MGDPKPDAYRLIVIGGSVRLKSVRLIQEAIVGRSPDCDLVLKHRSISREHARFFLKNGRCFVEDLDSHNGLRVNEEHADWAELQPGDTIDFGPCQIILRGPSNPSSGWLGKLLALFRG